jgi:hypothetical protein
MCRIFRPLKARIIWLQRNSFGTYWGCTAHNAVGYWEQEHQAQRDYGNLASRFRLRFKNKIMKAKSPLVILFAGLFIS